MKRRKPMFIDEAMASSRHAARDRMELITPDHLERRLDRQGPSPSFREGISRNGGASIIAEVKKKSPTAGSIAPGADVGRLASSYEEAGAAAVSVLTCEYRFGGSIYDLALAAAACRIPLLRKDFVSLPYQVLEAAAYGASAVLLIAEALEDPLLETLVSNCVEKGIEALVEAHTADGVARALEAGARVVGINNRDLRTLEVDPSTTERLLGLIPGGVAVVSESGIRSEGRVRELSDLGVDALLIGEELMRAADPADRLRELLVAVSGAETPMGAEGVDRRCG
jgi:indole-3-glycerol phosphate synthase